jgi:adenine-specific DNA-methyltransferase
VQASQAAEDLARRLRAASPDGDVAAVRAALKAELGWASRHRDWLRSKGGWADGLDVPGTAYEAVVRAAARRAAGQFQTPFWAADLMAGWLLSEPVRLLLDPGVGTGRLLFRAWQRPEPAPQRMLGLDIDPLCLRMARLNLALRGGQDFSLRKADFLRDSLRRRPDAIIANPPFSRHHAIPPADKEEIHSGINRRLGLRLSRRAGLHALFVVRALEVAADGARLAFIAPADWLDTHSGEAVKRFVLATARVEAIVTFNRDDVVFAGVRTRPAVLLLRKGAPSGPTQVLHLPAKRPRNPDAVLAAIVGDGGALNPRSVTLTAEQKWADPRARRAAGRPLGELARVRRGIATGCNRFFVLSEAGRRQHGLGVAQLRPCLSSPRLIEGTEVDGRMLAALSDDARRWVIDCRRPEAEQGNDELGAYLRHGRAVGAADTHLASKRRPWYAPEVRDECPILFPYMNSTRARFIRNRSRAVPLNTFLIIEPLDEVEVEVLWRGLNAQATLAQLKGLGRDYGDGMWKLEPRDLDRLRVKL